MDQNSDFDFMRYGRGLWRRKWMIALTVVVATLAAFAATRFGADNDPSTEAPPTYRATITVKIEGAGGVLPSNPALALLGIGDSGDRGIETHVQLMGSRNVLERAALKLRSDSGTQDIAPPVSAQGGDDSQEDQADLPFSIADELDQEIDDLATNMTVRAIPGTDLIEVIARASEEDVAERWAEVLIEAYQEFLVDEQFGQTRDALTTVKEEIVRIDVSTVVTPEVLALLGVLSREMTVIGEAAETGSEQLGILELDILASVGGAVSESSGFDSTAVGQMNATQKAQEILGITADALGFALGEIDSVSADFAAAEFEGVLVTQINALEEAATSLKQVGSQVVELESGLSDVGAIDALDSDIEQLESVIATLGLAATQLTLITEPDDDTQQDVSSLRNELESVVLRLSELVSSIGTPFGNISIETARRAAVDEATAGRATLLVVADDLFQLRRGESVSATDFGWLLTAEGNVRRGAGELQIVAASGSLSDSAQAAEQLHLVSDQIFAVADATVEVVDHIQLRRTAGLAGIPERDLLTEHILAANSTLQGVAAAISSLRRSQVDGFIFAQLVSAEAQINNVSESLDAAKPSTVQALSQTANQLLSALRKELSVAHVVTSQLVDRTETTLSTGSRGDEVRRGLVEQIESGAGTLLTVADELENVRGLDLPGTSAGSLLTLEARLRILSDGLFALNRISSSRDRLGSITVSAADAAQLINAVNEDTAVDDARNAVSEINVRLAVASTVLQKAASEVQLLADQDALAGNSDLALVAQRVESAGLRLESLSGRLPQIEGGSNANTENYLTLQGELELMLLSPLETSINTIDSSVSRQTTTLVGSLAETSDSAFLLGAVAGLFVGILGAIVLEFTDRSVREPHDLDLVPGLIPLGVVAQGTAKGNPHPPEVGDKPGSIFTESVQLLMNNVEECLDDSTRTVVVTSPKAREGKTMLAINLARTLEQRGKSVLLVDGNLRKPDASKILNLVENDGLANALAGEVSADELVVRSEDLNVLPAGNSEMMPVELISRYEVGAMLREFERQYDVVIIDGPPIVGFSDTAALAKHAGAAVIVVRAGKSKRDDVEKASEVLEGAGVKVFGAVVNFVKPRTLKHLAHERYGRQQRRIPGWLPRMPFSKN